MFQSHPYHVDAWLSFDPMLAWTEQKKERKRYVKKELKKVLNEKKKKNAPKSKKPKKGLVNQRLFN
jgi:hypothetical protein